MPGKSKGQQQPGNDWAPPETMLVPMTTVTSSPLIVGTVLGRVQRDAFGKEVKAKRKPAGVKDALPRNTRDRELGIIRVEWYCRSCKSLHMDQERTTEMPAGRRLPPPPPLPTNRVVTRPCRH